MQPHPRKTLITFIILLAVLDGVVWSFIVAPRPNADEFALYFLDVGQGDAALATFPGDVQVVIDGGPPNGRLMTELARILPPYDRYIDLLVMTHPQLDHYGGLLDAVRDYRTGLFVTNGRRGETRAAEVIPEVLAETHTAAIALEAGDRVRYGDYRLDVLSPSATYLTTADLNESGLVMLLTTPEGVRALYTADIGEKTETMLIERYKEGLRAQVLKVGHHGSKFSSSKRFLDAVRPHVATIGVGKNSYGHPTSEALSRLRATGAEVLRADHHGTVKVIVEDGNLRVHADRFSSVSQNRK